MATNLLGDHEGVKEAHRTSSRFLGRAHQRCLHFDESIPKLGIKSRALRSTHSQWRRFASKKFRESLLEEQLLFGKFENHCTLTSRAAWHALSRTGSSGLRGASRPRSVKLPRQSN